MAASDAAQAAPTAARRGFQRFLTEPPRPRAIARRPGAPWLAVGTVCVGAFMGQLDASIVTLALPTLQRTFHASLGAVTWVGLSYLLVLVATVTAVGRVADMAGRKLLYTYGFGVFILGSALCGLAPSLAALAGFRVLQAVGAAMLQANSVAIIYLALPRASLGRGIGIQGAAQALGLALGPAAGGLLLAAGGWRLIFLINVPLGLAGLGAGWLLIPRSRHLQQRAPFDWAGLALFIPAVTALLSAATLGNRAGWTSPVITGLLAGAAVLGAGFVRWERRARAPMLDTSLFRSPAFTSGATVALPLEPGGGWLPDGSRMTWLNAPSGKKADRLPVRVAEHNAVLPCGDGQEEVSETCTVITTLLDHEAAPADAVRETYLTRWSASETTFGEDKATTAPRGAGLYPSRSEERLEVYLWI